jgi:ABC-type Fe3+/spermidine/putrescine transport system ATPase subunit
VTHDQEEALALSDQVAVMRDGRIEQVDSPAALYDDPCNEFVAGFIGQHNFLDCKGTERAGEYRTDDGVLLRSEHSAAPPAATRYRAAIRPEHVRIATLEAPPGANAIEGTITAAVVLGETIQYVLQAARGGHDITIRASRQRGETVHREGDACWAIWSARDVRVFARDGSK